MTLDREHLKEITCAFIDKMDENTFYRISCKSLDEMAHRLLLKVVIEENARLNNPDCIAAENTMLKQKLARYEDAFKLATESNKAILTAIELMGKDK